MRFWKAWLIAKKDLAVTKSRRGLLVGMIFAPLALGIFFPVLMELLIRRNGFTVARETSYLGAFGTWFLILAVFLPMLVSSYSVVGEKLEKTMEPLLGTPTSDSEILTGKYISAFLPIVLLIFLGGTLYMILSDLFTSSYFGYLYFPRYSFNVLLFVAVPIASFYGIAFSVFMSSKATSAQGAYQSGMATGIPLFILYILGLTDVISLNDTTNVLYIALVLFILAIVLFYVSRATFNREEILTKWK